VEDRAHALIAGIFAFVLAAAVIAAAVWLSGESGRYKPYLLVAKSPVSGLNPEAQVRLRGVVVGKVTSIRFDPDNPLQILVSVNVDDATPVTRGTFATLGYQGITGLAYINLDDSGKDAAPLKSSPDQVARIELQPSFLDQLTQSGQELLITAGETAKRVNAVLDEKNRGKIADVLANLEILSKRIEDLLPDEDYVDAILNYDWRTHRSYGVSAGFMDGYGRMYVLKVIKRTA